MPKMLLLVTAGCSALGVAAVVGWQTWAQTPAPVNGPVPFTDGDRAALPKELQPLVPLHKPLGPTQSGDWLRSHAETPQNYKQFVAAGPVRATKERRTIWVQPLGEFNAKQRKIVELSAEFLGIYCQLPVQTAREWPESVVPEKARRVNPLQQHPQIQSIYILDDLLKPRVPQDAAALIAFTTTDLWPGEGWNFVFGQASLADRVGVWSVYRFGDPTANEEVFRMVLRRTLKIAAHETGHMFSLPHCVYFECCMNGSNNMPEADRQPLSLCPQCLAKLCYATGADPKERFRKLIEFAAKHKLEEERVLWERSLRTFEK